jgi:hypothetical protein
MTDDRKAGIALIAGSLGGILTMGLHPTASASLSAEQVSRLMETSGIAHSIGMVSLLLLFLGACGLTSRIAAADRLSFAAIVTFGFACVAVLIAMAVSGFIIPAIMKRMVADVPAAAHQWQIVVVGIFQINQAFARIYSVAASLATILWSISVLRNRGLGRGVAIYGCVVAPLTILGIGIGHLRLDVHGMAVIFLGQAIWFILVGSQLCSSSANGVLSPADSVRPGPASA